MHKEKRKNKYLADCNSANGTLICKHKIYRTNGL